MFGPRHVAAVAAAIGMLGCAVAQDHGVAEAAPPPFDPVPPPPTPPQPPLPSCPPDEEPALVAPPPFREDLGVAEAAPPPLDDLRYRHDLGVAEAAPPPIERPRPPLQHAIVVAVQPAAPLRFHGRRVAQPFALTVGAGTLAIGAPGAPIAARLCAVERSAEGTVLQIESDRPLTIHHDGARLSPPARVVVRSDGNVRSDRKAPDLVLEDPETGARLRMTLSTR